jgi:hypothetical protein
MLLQRYQGLRAYKCMQSCALRAITRRPVIVVSEEIDRSN